MEYFCERSKEADRQDEIINLQCSYKRFEVVQNASNIYNPGGVNQCSSFIHKAGHRKSFLWFTKAAITAQLLQDRQVTKG